MISSLYVLQSHASTWKNILFIFLFASRRIFSPIFEEFTRLRFSFDSLLRWWALIMYARWLFYNGYIMACLCIIGNISKTYLFCSLFLLSLYRICHTSNWLYCYCACFWYTHRAYRPKNTIFIYDLSLLPVVDFNAASLALQCLLNLWDDAIKLSLNAFHLKCPCGLWLKWGLKFLWVLLF
jgi:hypothetical protein